MAPGSMGETVDIGRRRAGAQTFPDSSNMSYKTLDQGLAPRHHSLHI